MKLCPKCQKHFSDDANFCPVDAARLLPLEAGQEGGAATDPLTSRFVIGAKLGGSRTGVVLRASEKAGGKAVVLKFVAPAVLALPGVAQRLERELKQLERVQSAGVAKVLGSGKRGEETWLALELVEGSQTLEQAIGTRGPIDAVRAADLVEVVGEALIEAAQVGVVHRDLAPKNVLFAGDQIKLINFSLPVPTSDKVPGVPAFVAPEQAEGKPVDQRSNIYSLGALYYYLLTGQAPGAEPRPPSALTQVPAAVDAVILRALDKSPTKRFLTVRQFLDEISRVAGGASEEFNPRSTMPMGRVGRPRAEIVQTLMGVRPQGLGSAPSAQAVQAPSGPALRPATVPPEVAAAVTAPTPALALAPTMAPDAAAAPSPWAPPAAQAAAPGPMAPAQAAVAAAAPAVGAVAAPVVAAPVVAAPVLAAPVLGGGGVNKKKPKEGENKPQKGKFRETMWFKKGELDAAAAQAAAEERATTGKDASADKADSLPIDDRYKDDGSIDARDQEKFSLRTGATQMMSAVKDPQVSQGMAKVSEDVLIGEMKGGRTKYFIMIAVGVLLAGGIVAMLAR